MSKSWHYWESVSVFWKHLSRGAIPHVKRISVNSVKKNGDKFWRICKTSTYLPQMNYDCYWNKSFCYKVLICRSWLFEQTLYLSFELHYYSISVHITGDIFMPDTKILQSMQWHHNHFLPVSEIKIGLHSKFDSKLSNTSVSNL